MEFLFLVVCFELCFLGVYFFWASPLVSVLAALRLLQLCSGGVCFQRPVWAIRAMGNPSCAGVIGVMPNGSKWDPMEQSLDQNDVVT
jgi:hypothetical protein